MNEKLKKYFIKNSEQLFVLTVLVSVSTLNYFIPYKLAFLNFYYIPVLIASYYLGRNSTLYGAILCVFWVFIYAYMSPDSFFFVQTRFSLFFNIIAWSSFLILAGIIVGNAQDNDRQYLKKMIALNKKLATHLAVSADLSSELDFDTLFPLIIRRLSDAMKAERTSLFIIDEEKQEMWTKAAEEVEEIRLPLGSGICGKVAETGDIINASDAWELPYFSRKFDLKYNFRTKAVLCMPIKNRIGKRIGVIQVINKIGGGSFDIDDEKLLKGLVSQVAIALENSFLMDELEASFESSIRTLSATVDAKHPLTAGHSLRVTEYALLIAKEMKLDKGEQEIIKYAALLHDIGKIAIKDRVLLKDGPFTPEERTKMNDHPAKTKTILEKFHFPANLKTVPVIAAYHHEKVNGQGYPKALKGSQLPLGSKILAVADVFDALTSPRDYPKYDGKKELSFKPMPLARVVSILKKDCGSHFESEVVDAFLNILPKALNRYLGEHFSEEYLNQYNELKPHA
jgi:putative nucleotidyltransferase with HDIG domain